MEEITFKIVILFSKEGNFEILSDSIVEIFSDFFLLFDEERIALVGVQIGGDDNSFSVAARLRGIVVLFNFEILVCSLDGVIV